MLNAQDGRSKFFNYPEARPGPDIPFQNERKHSPAMRGLQLVLGALLVEWLGFIRTWLWHNAGLGDLRQIRQYLDTYEPRFDPTVIPITNQEVSTDSNDLDDVISSSRSPTEAQTETPKYYSAADYHTLYASGELTPTAVAQSILPLIRRDTSPCGEHSIAWLNSRVDVILAAASASTLRYKEDRPLSIIDGVPMAVKDEYDVEGYETCLGSRNNYTSEAAGEQSITSWSVRKLEEAGAINFGKLSMHEFGLDTSNNNPNYGTPLNPFNKRYYTGGSSGGCAYAVSTGLIPIALGSDGGGSIRIPASFCSVYGLKPSHGRISYKPGINHFDTCSVNGPLAADMGSLSAAYSIIGAPDPACPSSSLFAAPLPARLAPSPSREKTEGILGIPQAWLSRSTPAIQRLCHSLLDRLVALHNYTIIPITIPFLPEGQTAHAMTMLCHAATATPDTRNVTAANKILISVGMVTPSTDFILAQKLRQLLMQHLADLWRKHPGMIIVTPTTPCAGWHITNPAVDLKYGISDGDQTLATMEYVWLANFAGLPSLTIPAGFVRPEGVEGKGEEADDKMDGKIPVGLMGTGEWGSEDRLLQWGAEADAAGADRRSRPPIWVDVVARAREEMQRNQDESDKEGGSAVRRRK
ncbi:hypothetical protein MMC11_004082 [Xylographa trunciseda]|nr:hypothetical protein [Xylographa trunciseda]